MPHHILKASEVRAILLLVLAFYLPRTADARQNVDRRTAYSGPKLTGDVFLCTSDQNTAGGYWYDAAKETVEQGASIRRESKVTTWRIKLRKNDADVIRFSGASQTIEDPEIYSVEVTRTGGLLMVWQNRPSGFSPQIITIDPTNSSFVYSSQHVDVLLLRWNRANIFYGTCRPYL